MYQLTGRIAVVTGGGQGIGRAIALRLADEGADVAIVDLNIDTASAVAEEVRARQRRALSIQCNVTDEVSVDAMIKSVVDGLGHLDIIVNNAGVQDIVPAVDMSRERWDRILDVNVTGVFLCAQAAARQMIAQGGGGRIINASSRSGKSPSRLPMAAYITSKHAVIGLTRSLAWELARYKITVNAYCPGVVDTAMWDLIDREMARMHGTPVGATKQRFADEIPLGRIQVPEDVAKLVAFLASDESDYMTGQAINITGGSEVH
jgi:meso-butanediol dehydrogenase / (S,S)-butanediol dehydrogenase / diacetyl reductase